MAISLFVLQSRLTVHANAKIAENKHLAKTVKYESYRYFLSFQLVVRYSIHAVRPAHLTPETFSDNRFDGFEFVEKA